MGGNGLGGLVWVWVGLAWARYFALSLPTAAAAASAGEASAARAGFFSRLRGVLGAAAWPAEAVSRPAGITATAPRAPSSLSFAAVAAADEAPLAAVATPRTPSSFSSAAAAAAGEAPAARAGSVPSRSRRAGGRGAAGRGGVAARRGRGRSPSRALPALLRCRGGRRRGARGPCGRNPSRALLALLCSCGRPRQCAWFLRRGCPPCRRRAGGLGRGRGVARCGLCFLLVWAGRGGGAGCLGGGGGRLCPGSRAGGGGPTSTAASASLRSSRSARVSPVHSGEETGERERDRRWWRSSRWGDPSESAITVTLVGMRGGRRALPTTSWCISAVPWAVPCGALRE